MLDMVNSHFQRQNKLDAQIRLLEQELMELKRDRNTLSPISQLPVDIMTLIFSFSVQTLRIVEEARGLPDNFRLGHVCHAWREMALSYPALWTSVQIRANTSPSLLELQVKNSGESCLSIDYYNPSDQPANLGVVSRVIRYGTKRLKSLIIYGRYDSIFELFRGSASESAKELEELGIHDGDLDTTGQGVLSLGGFADQTPKLQRLMLSNFIIPWTSPMLASRHLTELTISLSQRQVCQITHEYTSQLLSFLRCSPQLRVLQFEFPRTVDDGGAQTGHWTPVALPNLQTLQVHSIDSRPLVVLLPLLLLQPNIKLLEFRVSDYIVTPDHADMAAMLLALKQVCSSLSSPQQLYLTNVHEAHSLVLTGWRSGITSSLDWSEDPVAKEAPWITFTCRSEDRHILLTSPHRFPLANPGNLNLDWWFSDVRTLIIRDIEPIPALLETLSTLPTIQFLSLSTSHFGIIENMPLFDACVAGAWVRARAAHHSLHCARSN